MASFIREGPERPLAPLRLFLFPHAGGTSSDFVGWSDALGGGVVECVALVGRPLIDRMHDLVGVLVNEMLTWMDKPFVFFGHSAGAVVAFALARELQMRGLARPARLIVSASAPPQCLERLPTGWKENRAVMIDLIRSWGGTDEEILADDEAMDVFLRVIRADLNVVDSYTFELDEGEGEDEGDGDGDGEGEGEGEGDDGDGDDGERSVRSIRSRASRCSARRRGEILSIPISVFGGLNDETTSPEILGQWSRVTAAGAIAPPSIITGGHFYHQEESGRAALLDQLATILGGDIRSARRHCRALVDRWNTPTFSYPDGKCLHELFVEGAAKRPDAVAVVYEGRSMTFAELDRVTDILAAHLHASGVRPDESTAIFMEHCTEYVIAYIAALKAGGAYLPLEVVYPPELLERVLREASPRVVLSRAPFVQRLPEWQTSFSLDGNWIDALDDAAPLPAERERPNPDSLAYIVMSSGTTGVPKGICCPHRGAVHSYCWRLEQYPYESDDRVACHVFFVWELLRPLIGGVPLYVIPDAIGYDAPVLVEYLETHRITRILFTPSLLQLILDTVAAEVIMRSLAALRVVWLCGEVVTIELRNRFVRLLPRTRLLNLYSISECHDVSVSELEDVDTRESPKFAPCGRLIPNVRAFILDEEMRQVPVGVPGELYIGGPCLARNYLNMPEKTAERFVDNPFADGGPPGQLSPRLYRTGDRGRFLPSGALELMGRCDFMVKIRGYSVVLGAVEAAIAEHPLISAAVVVAEGAEGEDKRLVAFVVPENWDVVPSASNVRSFLKSQLPHYAIPSSNCLCLLEALPVHAASSKLDRRKLPHVELAEKLRAWSVDEQPSSTSDGSRLPVTTTELAVANIFAELLRADRASILASDNFFDLGGHSLLATRLVACISDRLGVRIALSKLLRDPVLERVAATVDQLRENGEEGGSEPPPATAAAVHNVDLPAEARLEPSIFPAPTRKCGYSRYRIGHVGHPPTRVFLTGATGFLGAHVLASLLHDTAAEVFCIVRAPDEHAALDRIESTLSRFGLLEDLGETETAAGGDPPALTPHQVLVERVVPIPGDLSKPLLGLDAGDFKLLAGEVDSIIHSGAEVNLVKPFSALKPANVLGTQEVLRLAVTNGLSTRVKPVHFVSTNGVFPSVARSPFGDQWLEDADLSSDDVWTQLEDGYSQSKWAAERLAVAARVRGLPVTVLRPGNLAPSSKTGKWNPHDFYFLLLRGCRHLGAVPEDVQDEWHFDFTPVDFAAKAVVFLAAQRPQKALGQVFHLQNPQGRVSARSVFEWLSAAVGEELTGVPYREWRRRLDGVTGDDGMRWLWELRAGLDSFTHYLSHPGHFDCRNLIAVLDGEIACPRVGPDLIRTYAAGLGENT